MKEEELGFIILRHVSSEENNRYWIKSYECVRKFHPEAPIMIIDDNSNPEFITNMVLYKTIIVYSEYPKRAEILPILYYYKYKIAKQAVLIQDSVFINIEIDVNVNTWRTIWEFEHDWDQPEDERIMLDVFKNDELIAFYEDKSKWKGTMGVMMIINYDFLYQLFQKYDFYLLINLIDGKYNRQSLERVFGCILTYESEHSSLLGNMQKYMKWGTTYDTIFDNEEQFSHLHVLKCWSGR